MGFVLALHLVRAYSCKMKNTTRNILLSLPLFLSSLGYGATVPTMDVTVSSANGKVAYKGTTNANGIFATGNLEPGNYVVEFHSKSAAVKGSKFGIAVSAGKRYRFGRRRRRREIRCEWCSHEGSRGSRDEDYWSSGERPRCDKGRRERERRIAKQRQRQSHKRQEIRLGDTSEVISGRWPLGRGKRCNERSIGYCPPSHATSSASWSDGLLSVPLQPCSARACLTGRLAGHVLNHTGGGVRTHTLLRVLDFESSASASSATPALQEQETTEFAECCNFRRCAPHASNSAPSIRLL